jgi:hypothetical protein
MHGQQPPPHPHGHQSPPAGYPPPPPPPYGYPVVAYRDPHDYYYVGQDDAPDYLHRDERDNPQAITGFSFGVCGLGLLLLSGGIAFLVSIPCSIVGMVVGKRGMAAVDSGRATKHRRYAKAGFVMSIVTCSMASLMAVLLLAAAVFPDAFDDSGAQPSALPLVRGAELLVRLAAGG